LWEISSSEKGKWKEAMREISLFERDEEDSFTPGKTDGGAQSSNEPEGRNCFIEHRDQI